MMKTFLLSTATRPHAALTLTTVRLAAIGCSVWLSGCINLAPTAPAIDASLPATFNRAQVVEKNRATTTAAPAAAANELAWQQFIVDPQLRQVISLALQNNRDLRIALLNVERAQALYRIERSTQWPELAVSASATRQRNSAATPSGGTAGSSTQYRVGLGLASYEIDLFSRVRNQADAALNNFFATQEDQRAAQISLVAEVATAWVTLLTDSQRLQLARSTLASQQASYQLTLKARELGGASGLAVAQAQSTVEAARGEVARYSAQVQQDRNALELLVGKPLDQALLPATWFVATSAAATERAAGVTETPQRVVNRAEDSVPAVSVLLQVPPELPSTVLQVRPDIQAAERRLQAALADVGAARAALFPRISLTAAGGTQSGSLAQLFDAGTGFWNLTPQLDLPLFDAGRRRANVAVSRADQAIRLNEYERALQTAFREVADALAERGTLVERIDAQQALLDARRRTFTLSEALFKNGASSYLDVLDAQRSLYTAQQEAISLQQAEALNRITLYRSLGGGWRSEAAVSLAQ